MTYIYLAKFTTKRSRYFYVGSHTWKGEGLDPEYQGSSCVARANHWTPDWVRILEVVSEDRKFVAEREWIEKYARKYGIADCAVALARSMTWISQFKQHGLMLNCHANDSKGAMDAARRKIMEFGKSQAQMKADLENLDKARSWFADRLKDKDFYDAMVEKAAHARSVYHKSVLQNGVSVKAKAASSNNAKRLNQYRRENGATAAQLEAMKSNMLKAVNKRHEMSERLVVTDPIGNVFIEHAKELETITGLKYSTLRCCKSNLERGEPIIYFKRGRFLGWSVQLESSYNKL